MNRNTQKFWMRCDVDPEHTWTARLYNVTRRRGCPKCRYKTEQKLYRILCARYGKDNVVWQYHEKGWLKGQSIDFVVFGRYAIELQGQQHFEDRPFFGAKVSQLSVIQERDARKLALVEARVGWQMIYMYQPDVLKDKNNWRIGLKVIDDYARVQNDLLEEL